jgi:toxin ParE1/3/4
MRRIRFAEAASDELSEGAAWYEAQRPGLGDEFIAAVRATLDRVRENLVPLTPILGECGEANAGKMAVRRFPYNVVVIDEAEERIVVAIAHQSRKPDYWQVRWPPDSATPI